MCRVRSAACEATELHQTAKYATPSHVAFSSDLYRARRVADSVDYVTPDKCRPTCHGEYLLLLIFHHHMSTKLQSAGN